MFHIFSRDKLSTAKWTSCIRSVQKSIHMYNVHIHIVSYTLSLHVHVHVHCSPITPPAPSLTPTRVGSRAAAFLRSWRKCRSASKVARKPSTRIKTTPPKTHGSSVRGAMESYTR